MKEFGTLDRSKLRQIVFQDPKRKAALEAILHPLIYEQSWEKLRKHAGLLLFKAGDRLEHKNDIGVNSRFRRKKVFAKGFTRLSDSFEKPGNAPHKLRIEIDGRVNTILG